MKQVDLAKRALCLWLPHWTLQRVCNHRPELRRSALVIYEQRRPGSFWVVDCSRLAAEQGVSPGMPLAEAAALAKIVLVKFDPLADEASLGQLAEWCEQFFSPAVAVRRPDCLLLDVTGLAPLFGGEQALVRQIRKTCRERGLTTHVALADTYAAAWAFTHFGGHAEILVPPREVVSALSPLPVAGLNLPASIEATLQELGIDEIGQLLKLPRASLASRFDAVLLQQLDYATGRLEETILSHHASPQWSAEFEFESPVADRSALELVVRRLLEQTVQSLVVHARGIGEFVCEFIGECKSRVLLHVGLYQATANVKHLAELAALKLERLGLPEAVHKIRLRVCSTSLLASTQLALFDEEHCPQQKQQLSVLVNRLRSRLGNSAVLRSTLVAAAQAEYAYRYQPILQQARRRSPPPTFSCLPWQRPVHLLPQPAPLFVVGIAAGPPRQFQWRRETFQIHAIWGPERIEVGWWRGNFVKRDYYRVETTAGNRYWLFRRHDGRWFLHGIFD